jgi:nitrate/nitrite transporter NarK
MYGFSFWMPQMIKSTGIKSLFFIGILTAIPNAVAIIAMIWAGRSSDRNLERRWHTLIFGLIASLGLGLSAAYGASTWAAVFAATVGVMGIMSTITIYWSVPTALLAGTASAGGIALVNSFGNLAGFLSPYMLGYIKDATKSLALGLYSLAALVVLGAILVVIFGPRRPQHAS